MERGERLLNLRLMNLLNLSFDFVEDFVQVSEIRVLQLQIANSFAVGESRGFRLIFSTRRGNS